MSCRKRDAATHTAQRACKIYVALISARGRVLIIHFLVTAHENTNVMGRRVWRVFSLFIPSLYQPGTIIGINKGKTGECLYIELFTWKMPHLYLFLCKKKQKLLGLVFAIPSLY